MADQSTGYAVLSQQGQPVADKSMYWGGSAVWILVWVVVIIIILALLAAFFCGGDWFNNDSSDDHDRRKKCDWNLNWLGGLVVFIVVILFLCWLLGAAGGYGRH